MAGGGGAGTRGFVVKRDGVGGIVWFCEVSSWDAEGTAGAAANISISSVAPALPGDAEGIEEDGGVYVAGVFTAQSSVLSRIYLACSSAFRNWTESLTLHDLAAGAGGGGVEGGGRHAGFVLRMNARGHSSWVQGPLFAVSGSRVLAHLRISPWLSTKLDTQKAHGMAGAAGEGGVSAVASGVYVIGLFKASAESDSDVVRFRVERYNTTAQINLTRVPGDAAAVALLDRDAGAVAWVRVVSGPSLQLDLGVPAAGVAMSSADETLLYVPASWSSGALTAQSCAFDVREAAPEPPPTTPAPPPPALDMELAIPPHVECYKGAPRGFAFVAPHDLILTGVRWPVMAASCSGDGDDDQGRMLQVQVAMMDASTEPPESGVSWTKGSASYTLLANYSGAPPPETEGPPTREFVEGPNGGGGGGWVSVGQGVHVPRGRTVAVWGHLDEYVSYAGSPSHPVNGAFAAHHGPFGNLSTCGTPNVTGCIALWRLSAMSMSRGTSVSLEKGPSFGRWRLSYRLAPSASTTPAPATTFSPSTPSPLPSAATAAAQSLVKYGVMCEDTVTPPDLSDTAVGEVDQRMPFCDDVPSWPKRGLREYGACRLDEPSGVSSALLLALTGTGELRWVATAMGGDVRLKALAHVQDALIAAPAEGGSKVLSAAPWGVAHLIEVMRRAAAVDSVVVVGEVRGAALSDWGRTVLPLSCSQGRRVGEKGLTGAAVASACGGQVRGQGFTNKEDVLVVRLRASDGRVMWVRRTGLAERQESVAAVALDSRGDAYVLGAFAPQAAGLAQGQEDAGGGSTGSDVFGLAAARRSRAVGCDADRRRDKVGLPLCTMRAHSPSDDGLRGPTTGFLMKMAGDARLLAEGSAGREGTLSLWGHVLSHPSDSVVGFDSVLPRVHLDDAYAGLVLEIVGGSGQGYQGKVLHYNASTHQVAVSPPLSAAGLLDGSSHVRVVLPLTGKVSESGSTRRHVKMDGNLFMGTDNLYAGMLFRIRSGPGAGYEGIIGSYNAATRTASDFDPPALPAAPTADSVWQILPSAPFTSRNSLASCSRPNDVACGSEGVIWARTLGYAQPTIRGFDMDARSDGIALAARASRDLLVCVLFVCVCVCVCARARVYSVKVWNLCQCALYLGFVFADLTAAYCHGQCPLGLAGGGVYAGIRCECVCCAGAGCGWRTYGRDAGV